jgi:hypothetical protein
MHCQCFCLKVCNGNNTSRPQNACCRARFSDVGGPGLGQQRAFVPRPSLKLADDCSGKIFRGASAGRQFCRKPIEYALQSSKVFGVDPTVMEMPEHQFPSVATRRRCRWAVAAVMRTSVHPRASRLLRPLRGNDATSWFTACPKSARRSRRLGRRKSARPRASLLPGNGFLCL